MSGFCREKIDVDHRLRPAAGILRGQAVEATARVQILAAQILDEARAEAERIRAEAGEQARRLGEAAEADAIRRAAGLIAGLERAGEAVAQRSRGLIVDLVLRMYDHLVMQSTPRKRIETSLGRLLREVPPRLVDAVLHVHPDDASLLPEVSWAVKPDASLPRGACRLEAASGEWESDFTAAAGAIRAVFADAFMPETASEEAEAAAAGERRRPEQP